MEGIRNFPDPELVESIRAGSGLEEAIRLIYRDYFDSLAWYVQHNGGNRQDAEDCFQEALVRFIESVRENKFRGEASVKTFLFSLNRHIWLNELKRRGRSLVREEKFSALQDHEVADSSILIADREARNLLVAQVAKLGENCRKILLLFYYENLPMKEILKTLHYENEQVVRNKKYKCLKKLEAMIREKPNLLQTLISLLHG